MLYGLIFTLWVLSGVLLLLLIFIQKGKGSLGLGNIGGGTQMLFGGSGGQDLFQKITWVLGAIFMGGSLLLALMKASSLQTSKYLSQSRMTHQPVESTAPQAEPAAAPQEPVSAE